jgi:hypothetical protein
MKNQRNNKWYVTSRVISYCECLSGFFHIASWSLMMTAERRDGGYAAGARDEDSATIARRRANRKFMLCLRFFIPSHHPSPIITLHITHHPSHTGTNAVIPQQ